MQNSGEHSPKLDRALEWAAAARAPIEEQHTAWCLVEERVVCAQVLSTLTPWTLSALWTDPLPTGCLSLQVGRAELALDHSPMPNPPPEAGSSRRVGRDLEKPSGPAKAWAPHILTHLPSSSVPWSKSLGLSGPESSWANKDHRICSGTRPVGGECGCAAQQPHNLRQASQPF